MKFATLGPESTCHHNAVLNYCSHFGLDDAGIEFFEDFASGLEMLHDGHVDFLVQNSAHLQVHYVTETYHTDISVVDTFIFPTKEMALLERIDVAEPQTLGLVSACDHYMEGITYPRTIYEASKPLIARKLLTGEYDAGLTHLHYHTDNPGLFRVRRYIGNVVTAWLVYGHKRTFQGTLMSTLPRDYYAKRAQHGVVVD